MQPKDLVSIKGVAEGQPYIKHGRNPELRISLKQYKGIEFESSLNLGATDAEEFIDNYKSGDSIVIQVWNYDYNSLLTDSIHRNIFERIVFSSDLSMYGLIHKNKRYIDLETINTAFWYKAFLKYFDWVLIFGIACYGIYLMSTKPSNQVMI